MYVALQLPTSGQSLCIWGKKFTLYNFPPCTYINFQTMGHPTLVFRPAHNEFSDNVPPYSCIYVPPLVFGSSE